MKTYPKVSIIIPVYNGSNYLQEAIESALNQTYSNCEILVVNDGSVDDGKTEKIAMSYGDKIRYLSKENGGVATALNLGIQQMKGEYFSWLSHDDLYLPDKVRCEVEELEKQNHPEGIAYSNFTVWDITKDYRYSSNLDGRYPKQQLCRGNFAIWVGGVHGCSLLIHKSHFDKCGLFNEKLKTTQDYDLWYRMFRNQNLVFIPDQLIISRAHPDQGSLTIPEHNTERKALYQYFIKHMTQEEKDWEFGSSYKYCADMITKFGQWGFQEEADWLKKDLLDLEPPKDIQIKIQNLKEEIKNILQGNYLKLYIFGAGFFGRELLGELQSRSVEVAGFVDNDPAKHGMSIDGKPCLAARDLIPLEDAVIVSMEDSREVMKQLKELGVNKAAERKQFQLLLFETPKRKELLMD